VREIVECRPIDFFQPGSLTLLAQFCVMAMAQEANLRAMQIDPANREVQKRVRDMAQCLNTTAQKLRLSIQSALRSESGKLTEREPSSSAARWLRGDKGPSQRSKGKDDLLFGANVVKF
jgi:hypothetical protein